jgi:hypothetical protein
MAWETVVGTWVFNVLLADDLLLFIRTPFKWVPVEHSKRHLFLTKRMKRCVDEYAQGFLADFCFQATSQTLTKT